MLLASGDGMIFVCPNCSSKYRIPEERFTRDQMRVKCRSCGLISTVTRPAQEADAREAKGPAGQAPHASGPDANRKKPRLFEHWYFLKGRERKGPYAFADLDKFAAAGALTEATYVWHPTFDGWKKIRDVKILRPLLERAAPSAAPGSTPPPLPPPSKPVDEKKLVADLLQASAPAAAPVRQPIHRTENLVNLLDQIEQQQAAERAEKQREAAERLAQKTQASAAGRAGETPATSKESPEKRKIVELLERLDRAEKQGEPAEVAEQSFFGDEVTILDVRAARGEDLNDVLRQLAEDGGPVRAAGESGAAAAQAIFDQGAIPDVAIPSKVAPPPAAMDRRKLVQEFSFMLRHERKNKRRVVVVIAVGLVALAGAAFGLTKLAGYLAVKPVERHAITERKTAASTLLLDDPTKARSREQQIADELNAKLAELRQKQTANEEEQRMAEEAARRVAVNSAQRTDRATGVATDDTPTHATQFEFKVEEKKSPSNQGPAAGSTIKPAGTGGKEEVVIGLQSSALKNAAANTFSEEEMTNIIRKKMKQFNTCKRYSVGMDQVQVLLDFTVGTSGTVSRISLKSDQPLPAELATCIRGELQKWTFPPPDKPASFTRNLILD
jgi:predicted Zn finger-like uncharacterized protein